MIRRAVAWLRAEIATPTVGQLADRLELAENAAARDAAQIAALEERLRIAEGQAHEQAGAAYKARADLNKALAANAALAEQLAAVSKKWDAALWDLEEWRALCGNRTAALTTIATLGAASRNGTARKLARLAKEAQE